MSDQGERGARWTEMNESTAERDQARPEAPGAEVSAGSTDFSEPAEPVAGPVVEPKPHDVWGKVESQRAAARPAAPAAPPAPTPPAPQVEQPAEPLAEWRAEQPAEAESPAESPDAEDVKVAPVPAEGGPGGRPGSAVEAGGAGRPGEAGRGEQGGQSWEGGLFDEGAGFDDGSGDPQYAPVSDPSRPAGQAKPGKPSSGNWQMPDWMADESAADAMLGGSPSPPRDALDQGGKSRPALVAGVGLLIIALIAAAAVFLMTRGSDGGGEPKKASKSRRAAAAQQAQAPQVQMPPDKPLKTLPGKRSKVLAMVTDPHSGLVYPRLAGAWQVPTKKNKLGMTGWSGQQILVTERHPGQIWYGQLLTGSLTPAVRSAYHGPQSIKAVTALAAKGYESSYYAFPHRTTPFASQPLTIDGHRGWLIVSYLTYKRAGVTATGELVATAVVDSGRPSPAVVFASLPNTHRTLWPDLKQFIARLKVAA